MEYNSLTGLFHSFTLFLYLCSPPYEWSELFPYKFLPVLCRCSHFSFKAPFLECELNSCLSLSLKVRVLKQLLVEASASRVSCHVCSSLCSLTEACRDSHGACRKNPGPSKERKLLLGRKNSWECRQKRQLGVCSAKLSAHEHLEGHLTYLLCAVKSSFRGHPWHVTFARNGGATLSKKLHHQEIHIHTLVKGCFNPEP